MRLSLSRLRAVLIGGAGLLLLVLVAFIGLGRYKSLQVYKRLLKRSGVTLTHDTNGFTYSQSLQGRTIFTLHAAKATQLGSGKWALHDAELTLFDRAGNATDHVRGAEIDYDEKSGIARAQGVVDMDLRPPQSLSQGGRAVPEGVAGKTDAARTADALAAAELKAAPGQAVHVRTSGLTYDRKRGIASTDQRVILRYGGMECTAVGADFNSGDSTVQLRAQVQMTGIAHGQPLYVIADHADMNRDSDVATLTRPVVTSNGRTAGADNALLHLRKDGSIERVEAAEHVVLRSPVEVINARRLDAELNAQMLPATARLSGGVVMTGMDDVRPTHGSAKTVDLTFNAQGSPRLMTASGDARLVAVDRRTDAKGLTRTMEGEKIVATFAPGGQRSRVRLSDVRATGGGHASGEAMDAKAKGGPSVKTTQVWGDDLRLLLAATASDKEQPQELYATGHTRLQQDAALGAQMVSSGDRLEVSFGAGKTGVGKPGMTIVSAQQSGHVSIQNRAAAKAGSSEPPATSTGNAEEASFDGETQRLALTGNAHLDGDEASLSAPSILVDQVTQDAEAQGGVQATMRGSQKDDATKNPAAVTHVMSATAKFEHAGKIAEFHGTDGQPARIWQDASQVQAATLLFDGVRKTFSARPALAGAMIHATFANSGETSKSAGKKKTQEVVRVVSPTMDYNDVSREATFADGVTIRGGVGDVRGKRAVVFLGAATNGGGGPKSLLGGSVDRVVLSGQVQMEQPGRHGSGDQLLYTAGTASYVLTGGPAHVVDAQQGSVTGTTLAFGDAGSTIVVAGDPGASKLKSGRVRSEITVRPKKEERQ